VYFIASLFCGVAGVSHYTKVVENAEGSALFDEVRTNNNNQHQQTVVCSISTSRICTKIYKYICKFDEIFEKTDINFVDSSYYTVKSHQQHSSAYRFELRARTSLVKMLLGRLSDLHKTFLLTEFYALGQLFSVVPFSSGAWVHAGWKPGFIMSPKNP